MPRPRIPHLIKGSPSRSAHRADPPACSIPLHPPDATYKHCVQSAPPRPAKPAPSAHCCPAACPAAKPRSYSSHVTGFARPLIRFQVPRLTSQQRAPRIRPCSWRRNYPIPLTRATPSPVHDAQTQTLALPRPGDREQPATHSAPLTPRFRRTTAPAPLRTPPSVPLAARRIRTPKTGRSSNHTHGRAVKPLPRPPNSTRLPSFSPNPPSNNSADPPRP